MSSTIRELILKNRQRGRYSYLKSEKQTNKISVGFSGMDQTEGRLSRREVGLSDPRSVGPEDREGDRVPEMQMTDLRTITMSFYSGGISSRRTCGLLFMGKG